MLGAYVEVIHPHVFLLKSIDKKATLKIHDYQSEKQIQVCQVSLDPNQESSPHHMYLPVTPLVKEQADGKQTKIQRPKKDFSCVNV